MTHRLPYLDFLRAGASLLVAGGHLRAFVFVDYVQGSGILAAAFYLVTGLGHQAVVIFFALSGYLVGGQALERVIGHRFEWLPYLARRLTRLWIVVIPGLFLTLSLDTLGQRLSSGIGYDGSLNKSLNSVPNLLDGASTLLTFLENLVFLQTVIAPVFGSNGPMWSLANEFWYYIFIPLCIWVSVAQVAPLARFSGLILLLAMVFLLPVTFVAGGIVWLAGAVAAFAAQKAQLKLIIEHRVTRIVALIALPAGMVGAKAFPEASDLWFGLLVAAVLPVWARLPSFSRTFDKASEHLAEMSFTFYLVHFPFFMLIATASFLPNQYELGLDGLIIFVAMMAAAFAYAWFIWALFERHTNRVYGWFMMRLKGHRRQSPSQSNRKQDI